MQENGVPLASVWLTMKYLWLLGEIVGSHFDLNDCKARAAQNAARKCRARKRSVTKRARWKERRRFGFHFNKTFFSLRPTFRSSQEGQSRFLKSVWKKVNKWISVERKKCRSRFSKRWRRPLTRWSRPRRTSCDPSSNPRPPTLLSRPVKKWRHVFGSR